MGGLFNSSRALRARERPASCVNEWPGAPRPRTTRSSVTASPLRPLGGRLAASCQPHPRAGDAQLAGRWASYSVSSFSASSIALAAVSPAPTLGVSPSVLALSRLLSRAALAYVGGFRYAPGLMSRIHLSPLTFTPSAPASVCAAPSAAAFVPPLLRSRVAGVASVRGVVASARRGRRLASADFSPAAVACGSGLRFLSRRTRQHSQCVL